MSMIKNKQLSRPTAHPPRLVRNSQVLATVALIALSIPLQAHAQETTTYTYDAKGRVISVSRSGGPASGTTAGYSYDAASNRTNVTVNNSPNGSGSSDSGSGATVRGSH